MNRGWKRTLCSAALGAWMAAGCARFRPPPGSGPTSAPPGSPPCATAAEAPPDGGTAPPVPPNGNRLKIDDSRVRMLQLQTLREQEGLDAAGDRSQNGFTRRLDEFHQRWYCRMDNAVRRADTMWLSESMIYDYELSTFALRTLTRIGGRSNKREFECKVRFRADAALPGLEKQMRLFVDNAGRNALPGADSLKQEDDTRLGLRAMWETFLHNQLDLSAGLRFSSSKPVVFADLEWEMKRDLGRWNVRLNPSGFWYSHEGFGQMTELVWTRPLDERKILQLRTAESSGEDKEGVEFEQSIRFAWLRSGRGRGWVVQASVFPHLENSDWIWDDGLASVSWRDALYRKWIYYTVTAQVDFPVEDDYRARPSLRIGLEMLFGGRIGDLM